MHATLSELWILRVLFLSFLVYGHYFYFSMSFYG